MVGSVAIADFRSVRVIALKGLEDFQGCADALVSDVLILGVSQVLVIAM